jgi:thioredoxin reductase
MNVFTTPLRISLSMKREARNEELYDVTIIGAGPSGLFAAFYAGMRQMKTKIVEALLRPGGQMSVLYPDKFVYDAPGHNRIKAIDLVAKLTEQAIRFSPTMIFNERIVHLEPLPNGTLNLISASGSIHCSRTVVIAAGIGAFSPKILGIPGEKEFEGRGVYYSVGNESNLKAKRVVIIGGGDTAVDWALHLTRFAKHVTLIHRSDSFKAHESSVSKLLVSDVRLRLFNDLIEIRGDKHGVAHAVIQNNQNKETEVLDVDAILICIGFKAYVEKIREWGLHLEWRSVLVNHRMETNINGVFAIGDIAKHRDVVKLNLIVTGWAQAAMAINYAKRYIDNA